jgi:hypothetical protein
MGLYAYSELRVVRTHGEDWENFTFALLMGVFESATKKTELRAFRMMQAPLEKSLDALSGRINLALNQPVLEYDDLKRQYAEMELRPDGAGIAEDFTYEFMDCERASRFSCGECGNAEKLLSAKTEQQSY